MQFTKLTQNLTKITLLSIGALSLASCAGFKEYQKSLEQPLTEEPAPQVQPDGTELNSEGIDYKNQFKTYLNPDKDKYQEFNRKGFGINYYVLDKYILRPLAVANNMVVSPDLQVALTSLGKFLDEPFIFVSNVITNQPKQASYAFLRTAINGVFGLGLIDWASEMGIYSNGNNLDYVAAYFDVKPGPYLMLPGLGPTYPRKFIAKNLVQSTIGSLAYAQFLPVYSGLGLPLTAYSIINLRSDMINQENLITNSNDPYALFKSVYIQNANYNQSKALDQAPPTPILPALDDDILKSIN